MNDLQLQQAVLDELEFDPSVDAAHIGVTAEKGVVTLSGHLGSYAAKHAALDAARRIAGVRALADEIQVRYPAEKKSSDDEIAKRAADMFAWDVFVPHQRIQITVHEGRVELTGTVDWNFQRISAEQDVRKLNGVVGVINNIQLDPPADVEEVKRRIEDGLRRRLGAVEAVDVDPKMVTDATARHIEKAIERRADIESKAIRVRIDADNTVVLEGHVKNWQERQAVENAAWSARGVKAVDDRLAMS